ncbi:hypothetical protein [Moorena sp. SIO3B2]|uniref:hypothetical protein n=1 Tax=Moorena sp. SIO3B2 TaxID=2607827 RepID=UPI0013CD00BE|nr:hypothetical protein [Moorena sp. SIO3B2]NEP33135.1 hypothetical protein [Moorena sp. SIO3B2]
MALRQKKKMFRRKQDALKRSGGAINNRRNRGLSPPGSNGGGSSGGSEARQKRANSLQNSDSESLTVSSGDVSKGKQKKEPKPTYDVGKGRMVYPVIKGGVAQYLPARSQASDSEIKSGAFVEDAAVRKEPVNTISDASKLKRPTRKDVNTGRTLFATTTTNSKGKEKPEYLPRQSEATALELSSGKYIPEKSPITGEELKQPPKIDSDNGGRKLFATKAADGSVQYFPKKNQATAKELAEGRYIEGFAAKDPVNQILDSSQLGDKRPTRKDVNTGRTLFATKTTGLFSTEYLPRQSEATIDELNAGKYIPEKDSIAGEELKQPPKTDPENGGRKLFATKAADGSVQYFPKKNQATAMELAEGRYLEGFAAKDPVNQVKEASNFKHPTARDVNTGRTLFATKTTGLFSTEYLPRQSEATIDELNAGKYIPEKDSIAGEELEQPPKTDPENGGRKLFATQGADGSIQYFPRKNQATAMELAEGRYLEGFAAKEPVNKVLDSSELGNNSPTSTEVRTGRTLFATETTGLFGTEYLPRQSEATIDELNAGKYIPEKASIAGEELYQPPKTDPKNGGRKLFATKAADGTIEFFPKKNEATAKELAEGRYLEGFAAKDPVNQIEEAANFKHPTVKDTNMGRILFATTTTNWYGKKKTEYLPRQSEATDGELLAGKYIPEKDSIVEEVLNKRPRYDFGNQRDLFAVKADDGSTVYLPKKSQATAKELSEGQYVPDVWISQNAPLGPANAMTNAAPKFDIDNNRKIFAVKDKDGNTTYLPRKSKATSEEKTRGLFIPDEVVEEHESKRLRTALRDDSANIAQRRAQRAAKLVGSTNIQ